MIIPIFLPNTGCAQRCIYCNQKDTVTGVSELNVEAIEAHIERTVGEYFSGVSKDFFGHNELAFYGGSFTQIPEDIQIRLLTFVEKYYKSGKISGVRISTRPGSFTREHIKKLKSLHLATVELGVQTSSDEILRICKRGHTFSDVAKSVQVLRGEGLYWGAQLMAGLPGSAIEDDLQTAADVADLDPTFVRICPTVVLKNTELEEQYRFGTYTPLSLEKAVDTLYGMAKIFKSRGIKIARMGLHDSIISNPELVVAGVIHPALRDLVEAKIKLDEVIDMIKKRDVEFRRVTINVPPGQEGFVRGQKNSNIQYLRNTFIRTMFDVKKGGDDYLSVEISELDQEERAVLIKSIFQQRVPERSESDVRTTAESARKEPVYAPLATFSSINDNETFAE